MANEKDLNLDPITREPGAHPVGTGVGAAAGGAALGAAAGAVGGPLGAAVGAIAGAVAGGLGGKAVAESVNPTAEDAYWRGQYTREPYFVSGRSYEDYAPAYDLGYSGRSAHRGNFADVEPHLSSQWESKRGNSSLTWAQASVATRAAWDRIDTRQAASHANADAVNPVDSDESIDTLNALLESSRDGEFGFRQCADTAESVQLKDTFHKRADGCRTAAQELETHITRLGGKPAEGGTIGGALHRGWVSVRGTLSSNTDQAMLDEAERGEDAALAAYRKALKATLPADVMALVRRQAEGAQRNHDEIKALRDAHKRAM